MLQLINKWLIWARYDLVATAEASVLVPNSSPLRMSMAPPALEKRMNVARNSASLERGSGHSPVANHITS